MVRFFRKFVLLIFPLLIIFTFTTINSYATKTLVFDDAMLFTEEERISLEEEANNLSNEYNMDIVIVTTNDAEGKTSREYADYFFDNGGFGVGDDYDGILFLIDMDNSEAYISTSGKGIKYLTDLRIENVLGSVFDEGLLNGDYYGAAMGFLKGTRIYLEEGIPIDQYNEPEVKEKNRITTTDVIISIIGGLITSALFYIITKASYKTPATNNQFSYRDNSIINLMPTQDRLVYSHITHRVIPKESNTSNSSTRGRSTTHTSSNGRTHGGGGRKF